MKMLIHLSRISKIPLFILFSISTVSAYASEQSRFLSDPYPERATDQATLEQDGLRVEKGMLMLDYEVIPVPGIKSIDLLGVHYFQQLNDWLYLGLGLHAPLVTGNYGGFMAFNGTIHTQQKISGNWFVNAGASFGGGGGGSSVEQSKEFSGTGGFIKTYAGLGYEFRSFSLGINYAHFRFIDSQINHSQLDFFIQKPFSYSISPYANSGKTMASYHASPEAGESMLTLEANNIFQINPTGLNKETINSLSLQFARYLDDYHYLFIGADIGYRGLPIYNQVVGGIGYRFPVSPRLNLYSQLGFGSGGYSPDEIDTGPGLLVHPKFSVEYLLTDNLGLSASTGYLLAPRGTSKNFTLGAAMNYHLSSRHRNLHRHSTERERKYKGFRISVFPQTEFNVRVKNDKQHNINMLSAQFDYLVHDNWYFATQASVAYNEFLGYPGYGEILAGMGIQNKYSTDNSYQRFFQILVGANVHGIVLKPSLGINHSLSDNLALYGQLGRTLSVNKFNLYRDDKRFSSYHIGLGLTYRFSLM